jgi:hypothetical protein
LACIASAPNRTLVRAGLGIVFVAVLLLLDTIEPELDNASFLVAMGVLGIGMGLIVSQLGNVVQSSVDDADRSEAGVDSKTADALVDDYEDAQLKALKTALLFATLIVLASFSATRRLPTRRLDELQPAPA